MPTNKYLLIDGYNVIHILPELKPSLAAGLENARLKLALFVAAWNRNHPSIECVIVFDGSFQFFGARDQRLAGIRCIFSQVSHGADDEIIRFVREKGQNAADIIVVSDDNNVRNNCRAHGASIQPTSFLVAARASLPRRAAGPALTGKRIGQKAAAEIDKELKKKFRL